MESLLQKAAAAARDAQETLDKAKAELVVAEIAIQETAAAWRKAQANATAAIGNVATATEVVAHHLNNMDELIDAGRGRL